MLDQIALDLAPLAGDVAPSEERVRPEQHRADVSSVSRSSAARRAQSLVDRWVIFVLVITLDRVTKRYGADSVAVAELSLTVPDGELCVLVGPSGCGKTTTLRMINRLIEPSGGRILIDGDGRA